MTTNERSDDERDFTEEAAVRADIERERATEIARALPVYEPLRHLYAAEPEPLEPGPAILEGPAMRAAFGALLALAPMNDSQIPLAEPATAVERLTVLRELAVNVGARMDAWAWRAREAGATWQQIGDALDTTRQAAQQRYGR